MGLRRRRLSPGVAGRAGAAGGGGLADGRSPNDYAVGVGLALLGHVVAFGAVVVALGGLEAITLPWGPVAVVVGYPLAVWVAVAVGGPATGRWTPAGDGLDERVPLGLVALGYAIATAVGIALFAEIAFAYL